MGLFNQKIGQKIKQIDVEFLSSQLELERYQKKYCICIDDLK